MLHRPFAYSSPLACVLALGLALGGCSNVDQGSGSASGSGSDSDGSDSSALLDVEPDPWLTEVYKPVQEQASQMSVADFLAEYPTPAFLDAVSYDAMTAVGLPEIAAHVSMGPEHDKVLAQNGFVAVADPNGQNFAWTYHDLYYNDLPVLITTDSILYALHASFDAILMELEKSVMVDEIDKMLAEMHAQLASDLGGLPAGLEVSARDLDVYLAVGRTLMTGEPAATVTGAEAAMEVERILTAADALQPLDISLFGVDVTYDFSQLKPRGHYEEDPILQRYFKAMIWLGRTDMQMITFETDGTPVFNRRGLDAAFVTNLLLTGSGADARWGRVNKIIERLIGERDSMGPQDMVKFMAETGVASYGDLAAADDDALFKALAASPYGIQRIMSQIMFTDPTDPQIVLPRVFLLMGQRFTIDSYVFNNVTYDRVQDLRTGTKVTRMLPSELDVAFALGNNAAAPHLVPELDSFGYQGVLHELRFLIDAHPSDFWDMSFYNGWLAAIRALADAADFDQRPQAMRTRAWADKTLNTQLASWAELRHDTLLYVKQSYSGGNGCEYPDAYVEPAPAFYDKMVHLGGLGEAMADELIADGYAVDNVKTYFASFAGTMGTLGTIAHKELEGDALTQAEFDFLRGAVEQELVGCGEVLWDGWYVDLLYDYAKVDEFVPVIADTHTAPTDAVGNPVGWVFHGATGRPMHLVMTVEDCSGVRAFVGPVSSFHPVLTENYQRLADSEWRAEVQGGPQPRPAWASSFIPE
ncbi:MAG: DUF3160 domain-containing protein [Myxococcales bacterium]|nr:DUF3160 domain-containing protein [Myxococcales bacterium]